MLIMKALAYHELAAPSPLAMLIYKGIGQVYLLFMQTSTYDFERKKKMKKTISLVLIFVMVISIASVAFAVKTTYTPNGYTVVHDSGKAFSGGYMSGWSSTNVYKTNNPSETKYHYTRVWIIKDGGGTITDSDRVWGYNTVTANTSWVDNVASYYLRSAWGGVY